MPSGPVSVTWEVANTDLMPVNCANVDIDLLTFAPGHSSYSVTSLAAATPNDGNQSVNIPDSSNSRARFRVKCSNNIFYDISDADLDIQGSGTFPTDGQNTFFNINGTVLVPAVGTCAAPTVTLSLISPAEGATGLGTMVTFVWKVVTHPNPESLTYQFFLCEDAGFVGCAPTVVTSVGKIIVYASAEGLLPLAFFGTVVGGIGLRRRKWLMMVIFSLAIIGLVSSCGGSGGGDSRSIDDPAPTDEMSHSVSGLNPATRYYWKVTASDGIDTVESATRNFTT